MSATLNWTLAADFDPTEPDILIEYEAEPADDDGNHEIHIIRVRIADGGEDITERLPEDYLRELAESAAHDIACREAAAYDRYWDERFERMRGL